jgi:uncharacterized protein
MSEANKAVVLKFIEAFSAGDAETAATCLAPDAVITAKGFGKLSGPRQRDMILATTAAFKTTIPTGLRPRFTRVIAEDNSVMVEFEGNAVLANGAEYNNQYCMVYTLENGLITASNEYYCTLLADERILPLLADVEAKRETL